MNTVTIERKNVYGNDMLYPVCDNAKTFAALIGKKTFTRFDLEKIEQLGFTVEYLLK